MKEWVTNHELEEKYGGKERKKEEEKDIARGKAENKIRNGRKDDCLLTKDKPQEQQ